MGTYYALHATDTPAAPVVLVHGVGMDHTMWDRQVQELSPQFQVLRYDLLGHGRTPHSPATKAVADFVAQLVELLQHLAIDRFHLVGFSLGGLIAQKFCGTQPERLLSVTFMSTVYQRTEQELEGVRERLRLTEAGNLKAIADAAIERWFRKPFRDKHPELMAQIHKRLLNNDLNGYFTAYRCFVQGDPEIGDALTKVTCPALVITGECDVGSTPAMCERMARDLQKPTVKILPGLHHLAPVEGPDAMNKALLSFLSAAI
ncbi:MAG: alpha/beta fold hydrolase [Gammaproteobacteria bacterium]|nr:alpha/beta fold hydrolase [Gammaproteobacteria bacterium]